MADEFDNMINSMKLVKGTDFPPFFKFEKPGIYVSGNLGIIRTINNPNSPTGTAQIADISTRDGTFTITLTSDLQRKLVACQGKFTLIRFVGWRNAKTKEISFEPRTGGNPWFKEFEVYVK